VFYQGHWFDVAAADRDTKATFSLLMEPRARPAAGTPPTGRSSCSNSAAIGCIHHASQLLIRSQPGILSSGDATSFRAVPVNDHHHG
jgi:hypothetical protein